MGGGEWEFQNLLSSVVIVLRVVAGIQIMLLLQREGTTGGRAAAPTRGEPRYPIGCTGRGSRPAGQGELTSS
jgi:hypothetical protein